MHGLIVWIQDVAVPQLGLFGMFLVATLDASFFSLPELSDLLVVTGAAKTPGIAWEFVLASALGSMTGCLMLYEVARRGGEKLAMRFVSPPRLVKAKALLTRYGVFAIAAPALSPPPFPFKGFVLAAGIFAMPRLRFAATVLLARGLRFTLWALLGAVYGDRAIGWVKGLDTWVQGHLWWVVGAAAILVLASFFWWRTQRRRALEVSSSGSDASTS